MQAFTRAQDLFDRYHPGACSVLPDDRSYQLLPFIKAARERGGANHGRSGIFFKPDRCFYPARKSEDPSGKRGPFSICEPHGC